MNRRAQTMLVAAGISTAIGVAQAYVFTGASWSPDEMPIQYKVNRQLSSDLPDANALAAIQGGFDVWTELSCAFMAWQYAGRTDNNRWGSGDRENVVSWREEGWDDSGFALAITSSIWQFQGTLTDTDIKFNGVNHSWAAFENDPGFAREVDIESVAAHEVGHAVGLDHTNVPGSTMLPSTSSGEIGGRTLGEDDIAGACEIYPGEGEIPEPIPDPDPGPDPEPGTQQLGESCGQVEQCVQGLFCISDGQQSYCSRPCREGTDCPAEFYCAQLSGGGGACASGEDPASNLGDLGDVCGEDRGCKQGLFCVNDGEDLYCTGPCSDGTCDEGFFCTQLQNGSDACARGDGPGPLPGPGEPCGERGLCADGLFCLNDPINRDPNTDQIVPYCTAACPDRVCDEAFRCVDVAGGGTACQLIPVAGDRRIGDPCWINPENPLERPTCGDGLNCVNTVYDGPEIADPGVCSKNCTHDDCCPAEWGCAELTPAIGICQENQPDDEGFECTGDRPSIEPPDRSGPDGGTFNPFEPRGGGQDGGGGGGSCAIAYRARPWGVAALVFAIGAGFVLRRRRRR